MTIAIAKSTSGANDQTVRHLNSLLKGEISATETYRMAIDKSAGKDTTEHTTLLQTFQTEHAASAGHLRLRIQELGGETSDTSGAWGAWAKTVQGAMNIFGTVSSLKALKEGEDHGLKDYESAAREVDAESRQLIENQLIPPLRSHLAALDQTIEELNRK
jgi:hypothetical protein